MPDAHYKQVAALQIGDKIVTEAGKVVTIQNLTNGFYHCSRIIEWAGDWSCQRNDTEVEVKN